MKVITCSENYPGLYSIGWVEKVIPKMGEMVHKGGAIIIQICILERCPYEEGRWEQ